MERAGKIRRGLNTPPEKNIQVVVRCRPRNVLETKANSPSVVHCNGNKGEILVKQKEAGGTKTFAFDKVFGPDSTQIMVYKEVVCPIIEEVLQGYNCTVFAYGQTGTGKTYTMEGGRSTDGSVSWENDPLAGVIPRSLHQLFEMLETQNIEYSVRVSFLELYNEELFDLLSLGVDNSKLRIFEDSTRRGSVVIQGLEELVVNDKNEVYAILERGSTRRKTAGTLLNACSSRSHSVFSVTIHMKENSIDGEEMLKIGKLNLVDLAGSENIGRSGAIDKRAREAGSINQSLLTLGRVITSLVEKTPHIPYRESKLTRILQDSLGGRTKTSIIATISPSQYNIEETLSTLDYAYRAKNITNRPEVNQKFSKRALIKEYTEEIERLKKDLYASREKNGIFLSAENFTGMENKISCQKTLIKDLEDKIIANTEEMRKLNDLFMESQRVLVERNAQLHETSKSLASTQVTLSVTRQDLATTTKQKEEGQFLVDEHVKYEQVACHEAEKLLGVVNETISDVDGLHSKLERKSSVEKSNVGAASGFQSHLHSVLDALQSSMTSYSQSQQLTCKDFSNVIESWTADASREMGFIKNTVGIMLTCISKFTMTEQATSQKNMDDVAKDISRMKSCSCAFKENMESQTSAMMADFLCPQLQNLSDILSKHQGNIEKASRLHKDQLAAQCESVSEFVNKQRMLFSSLSSRLDDQNTRQSSEAACYQQDLNKIILDQLCSTQKMQRDCQAALDLHQTQLTNALRQVSDSSQIAFESRQADAESLQKSLLSMSCEMKQHSTAANSALRDTATSMDTMLTQHKDMGKLEEQAVNDVRKSLVENVGTVNQVTGKHVEDTSAMCAAISCRLAINIDKRVHSRQLHNDGVRNDCAKLQSSLDDLVDQRVVIVATQWKEEVNKIMDSVGEIVADQGKLRKEAGSTLDRYISEEMKIDTPTGNTPQRRDFDYPPHLTKIRDHSELLAEHRANTSNSLHIQRLPDLSESDEEWYTNSTSAEESAVSVPSLNLDSDVTMDITVTAQANGSMCTEDGCSPIYMDKENSMFNVSKLTSTKDMTKKTTKNSGSSKSFTKKTKKTLASSTKKPLVSTTKKPPNINKK